MELVTYVVVKPKMFDKTDAFIKSVNRVKINSIHDFCKKNGLNIDYDYPLLQDKKLNLDNPSVFFIHNEQGCAKLSLLILESNKSEMLLQQKEEMGCDSSNIDKFDYSRNIYIPKVVTCETIKNVPTKNCSLMFRKSRSKSRTKSRTKSRSKVKKI